MKKIIISIIVCVFASLTLFGQANKKIYKKFTDTTFKSGDIILAPVIIYYTGRCEILLQAKDSVKIIAGFLKKHPTFKVEIGSHTDNRGKMQLNIILSECRATAIVEYLKKEYLIPKDNLVAKGYGNSHLLISDATIKKVNNRTEEGREEVENLHAKNRRVEIKILKTE